MTIVRLNSSELFRPSHEIFLPILESLGYLLAVERLQDTPNNKLTNPTNQSMMTAYDKFQTSLQWCCQRIKVNNDSKIICVVPYDREAEFITLLLDYDLQYTHIKSMGKSRTLRMQYAIATN